jgi:hypothetical protein
MSQAEASEWRIAVKGEQRGPFALDQVRTMLAEGRLPPDTLVWKPGMANWAPIGSVAELTAPVSRGTSPVAAAGPVAAAAAGAAITPSGPSPFVEFLTFRRMVTPIVIQIIFWIGVGICVLSGIGLMILAFRFGGIVDFLMALGTLILGPLMVRIYCELLILLFRIHDTLQEIKNQRK